MGFGVWGLGFGVWGLGFGVWGLGFGVWGLGFGVWGLGFGVWGLGFGVWGLGFGVWGLGFGVWGLGFGVQGLGFGVWGFWDIRVRVAGFRVEGFSGVNKVLVADCADPPIDPVGREGGGEAERLILNLSGVGTTQRPNPKKGNSLKTFARNLRPNLLPKTRHKPAQNSGPKPF